MPVPAGMSLPMMTFSLRPSSWSERPSMAASVSPPVVPQERRRATPRVGGQRRLGDPHELGAALGRLLPGLDQGAVRLGVDPGVDLLAGQELGVARFGDG